MARIAKVEIDFSSASHKLDIDMQGNIRGPQVEICLLDIALALMCGHVTNNPAFLNREQTEFHCADRQKRQRSRAF